MMTIIIPDSPTNGDVLKTLYPNHNISHVQEYGYDYVYFAPDNKNSAWKVSAEWWYSLYKYNGANK